jgi:hypothetical protein
MEPLRSFGPWLVGSRCGQYGIGLTRSCSVTLVPALSLKLVARRHIDYGRTRSMICMSA